MNNKNQVNELKIRIANLEDLKKGIEIDEGKGSKQWFSIMNDIMDLKEKLIELTK